MNNDNVIFPINPIISIVGLGYVGLPLAVEFAKKFKTIGYDINEYRIKELLEGVDSTNEVEKKELKKSIDLKFTWHREEIQEANVYIVTVPTPIDKHNQPDLTFIQSASQLVGSVISPGDIVIYESTVYPGVTEEICVPELETASNLIYNKDFFVGYSPERINPGDKVHRLPDITKVVSGSTPEVTLYIDKIYSEIITAGTHRAESIKIAEAAKVIENTQRDLNIALINELSIIFNKLNIDTTKVLNASSTKWNFLNFKPGLVGGHCIGVDPYYLTYKAEEIGYHPEVILSGRRVNDSMGEYVASQVVKKMIKKRLHIENSNVLILGFTFKENCPDVRNTKVVDIVNELKSYGANVSVYDPLIKKKDFIKEYNFLEKKQLSNVKYDAVILAVAHKDFIKMGGEKINQLGHDKSVLFDIKSVLPIEYVDSRL